MTKRVKYSKEFKLDGISLVSEQGYERKAAAESLGIKKISKSPIGNTALTGVLWKNPQKWSF